MILKGLCSICKKEVYVSAESYTAPEDLNKIKSKMLRMESFTCPSGDHTENMSPLKFIDFNWEDTKEDEYLEGQYLSEMTKAYRHYYEENEFKEKFTITSEMWDNILCYRNDDVMATPMMFITLVSPLGSKYYVSNDI